MSGQASHPRARVGDLFARRRMSPRRFRHDPDPQRTPVAGAAPPTRGSPPNPDQLHRRDGPAAGRALRRVRRRAAGRARQPPRARGRRSPRRLSADGLVRYDWWGAGHDTVEEGYFIRHSPLADGKDLDAYAWPDPNAPGLLAAAQQTGRARRVSTSSARTSASPCSSARGRCVASSSSSSTWRTTRYAADLLDRITEIQLVLIGASSGLGVDGGYFGDDYGAAERAACSRRAPGGAHQAAARTTLRAVPRARAADHHALRRPDPADLARPGRNRADRPEPGAARSAGSHLAAGDFGGKLAFYGGISTQTVLPNGTPADVRRAVAACIRIWRRMAPAAAGAVAPDDDRHPVGQRRCVAGCVPAGANPE